MKQHITTKQVNELSKRAKEKLRVWWKPAEIEYICWKNSTKESLNFSDTDYGYFVDPDCPEDKKYALPLLSIGQMIEFLDEHKQPINGEDLWWIPRLEFQQTNGELYFDMSWYGELCDGLWESVKEALESL